MNISSGGSLQNYWTLNNYAALNVNQGVTLENVGGTMNNGTQTNNASAVLTVAQGGQMLSYATMNNYGKITNNGGLNDSPVGFFLRGSLNNYGIITNSGDMEIDASLTGTVP